MRVVDVELLPGDRDENGWIERYEGLRRTGCHRVEYHISTTQGQEKYVLFGGIGKARAAEASFELHTTA